jgi:hypothetical protein
MNDDKLLLFCQPADSLWTVRGSTFSRCCSDCGQRVMISPAGGKMIAANAAVTVVCISCGLARAEGQDCKTAFVAADGKMTDDPKQVTPQLKEVIPNMRRYRN